MLCGEPWIGYCPPTDDVFLAEETPAEEAPPDAADDEALAETVATAEIVLAEFSGDAWQVHSLQSTLAGTCQAAVNPIAAETPVPDLDVDIDLMPDAHTYKLDSKPGVRVFFGVQDEKIAEHEAALKFAAEQIEKLTNNVDMCNTHPAGLAMDCVRTVRCSCSVFGVRNM